MVDETIAGDNLLNELARTMTAGGRHATAIALRKLAREGYTSLEQVDNTSDWVLLAIPGIREGRLGEIRRLCRPDWQPPSTQAIRAANRLMSAARCALRHWSPELLASVIRDPAALRLNGESVDKRLALEVFATASEYAQRYCEPGELVEAVWQISDGELQGAGQGPEPSATFFEIVEELKDSIVEQMPTGVALNNVFDADPANDSDHFAHPRHKRIEIVRKYWLARENREIQNKDAWARSQYQITGKTLLCYEREFQEHREAILAGAVDN